MYKYNILCCSYLIILLIIHKLFILLVVTVVVILLLLLVLEYMDRKDIGIEKKKYIKDFFSHSRSQNRIKKKRVIEGKHERNTKIMILSTLLLLY